MLCAEGYLFELERRGYLQAGAYVPEVVLDHPEVVAQLHREFMRAGSDVVEAFTYYGHREKLRLIGKEDKLEALQRNALAIATTVAGEAEGDPPLVAGNISNTTIYAPGDAAVAAETRAMFDEQVAWAAEAGVDMVMAETFSYHGEAMLALQAVKRANLPAVVTLAVHQEGLIDGVTVTEAARRLEQAGGRCCRPQLRAGAGDDATDRSRDSGGGGVPGRGAACAIPDDAGAANVPVAPRPGL